MKSWMKEGFIFGLILFAINSFLLFPDIEKTDFKAVLIIFLFSIIGGLGYGYSTKLLRNKWKSKN